MIREKVFYLDNVTNHIRIVDFIVLLCCMVLIPSVVIQGLIGIDERITFALLAPIALAAGLASKHSLADRTIIILILFLTLIGITAATIAWSSSQVLMAAALSVSIVIGVRVYTTLTNARLLTIVSWFALILLIGGIIGIIYAFIGGSPIIEVDIGYRETSLYLTTFSFATVETLIRPAGIFDEPGSFTMYIAFITMFNDCLRQNRRLNFILIILLAFTGSLAGLFLVILYFATSNSLGLRSAKTLSLIPALGLILFLLPVLAPANVLSKSLDTFYSQRLQIEDGRLVGDNRSNQISYFFEVVDSEILKEGAKNLGRSNEAEDMSSNPFTITYGYGLIISLPYFVLLAWLLAITMQNRFQHSYASLGLLFLLLQRPYIYSMTWSILIAATAWLVYQASRSPRQSPWNRAAAGYIRTRNNWTGAASSADRN